MDGQIRLALEGGETDEIVKDLQELIARKKQTWFTTPDQISDADALGILISHWAWEDWDNRGTTAILQAAGSALEDCNYHSAARIVREMESYP